jgi:AcrR family transcriptional regulator
MSNLKRKPGRPSLSNQEKEQIRDTIIAIARELFVTEGYEQTSMRKIAAQAGFAPTKIYYYFENKKEILKHFWSDISFKMWEYCKPDETMVKNDPLKAIQYIMRKVVEYWLIDPNGYHLLIETQDFNAENDDNFDFYHTRGTKDYLICLMGLVKNCMDNGTFAKDQPQFICQVITSSVFGIYGSFYSLPSINWVDKERLIEFSIENTLKGLQTKNKV